MITFFYKYKYIIMKKYFLFPIFIFLSIGYFSPAINVRADTITRDVKDTESAEKRLILPYAFWTEANGWYFGLAGGIAHVKGTTTSLGGTAAYSTEDSKMLFFMLRKVQMPRMERLFFDAVISTSQYNDLRAYINGNPDFLGQDAGSNDSAEDDFIEGPGMETMAELAFKYVLPLGHGRSNAIHTYILSKGLLASGPAGGESWNPIESGRSFLELKPFYRKREYDDEDELFVIDQPDDLTFKTNGLKFTFTYDNRDFHKNPEKGSELNLRVSRDFGWFDSTDSWTVVEGDFSKYFSLGATSWSRQQVLAFKAWTADTPSWEETLTPEGIKIDHRPPYYEGATLGGFNQLKAYPFYRYNDRAAVYYSAEYRFIPEGTPFLANTWLMKRYQLDWWQFVAFVEAGRVADTWSISELHSDMQWDVGLGLRAMLAKNVFRLDLAYAEDSFGMWAMVGQAF